MIAIYLLLISKPLKNLNTEAMDEAMAIGYLSNPNANMWNNYKEQDPGAFSYTNHNFHPEWVLKSAPILTILCYPFVKIFGVNYVSITAFSIFFSVLVIVLTFLLALKMTDKWTALIACFFLLSSLSFVIHSKASMYQHMPSVCLMIGIAYCLLEFETYTLTLLGVLLSLCYLTGWIVFPLAVLLVAVNLGLPFFMNAIKLRINIEDVFCGIITAASILAFFLTTTSLITGIYSLFTGYSFLDINHSILSGYLSRFTQGSVPSANLSWYETPIYCLKLIFWDMTAIDHPDKYMEGRPMMPFLFSQVFIIGLVRVMVIDRHLKSSQVLIQWLLVIMGFLMTAYLSSGRYLLLVMPCMAIMAAIAVTNLMSRNLLIVAIFSTIIGTWVDYSTFTQHSKPNFERDRLRGFYEFSQWLRYKTDPSNTMVVLGDPINLSAWPLMLHNYEKPYNFVYWTNYKDKSEIARIPMDKVYVFAATLLGDPPVNSWFGFLSTRQAPDFTYSYDGRDLFFAFIVKK